MTRAQASRARSRFAVIARAGWHWWWWCIKLNGTTAVCKILTNKWPQNRGWRVRARSAINLGAVVANTVPETLDTLDFLEGLLWWSGIAGPILMQHTMLFTTSDCVKTKKGNFIWHLNQCWIWKRRKNCETALTPGIPCIPGIPGLWNLAEIVKFGQPPSVWSGRVWLHFEDVL